jgi:flagellar protein FliS
MSLQNTYLKYRQSQIETTPKLKLIVMLFDGAIRFLQQSIPYMKESDFEQKGKCINRSLAIISHLTGTLDFTSGGELADNLCRTYLYLTQRLVEANHKNDPAIVNEVVLHLRVLRDAWNTVSQGTENEADKASKTSTQNRSDLSLAA